jgi:Mrp family chromosome partitioning ATPase
MFEDQKVELLPERTTMNSWTTLLSGNHASAVAANVANINTGRGAMQANLAAALSLAGSAVRLH